MTKLTVILAILASMLLVTSCKKELDPQIPVGAFFKITAQGKLQNNLEYSNGQVSRILAYSNCETPYSIVEYGYTRDQITSIRSGTRGILSSWSGAMCDPDLPFDFQTYTLKLNNQNRYSKVTSENMIATFSYAGLKAAINVTDNAGKSGRRIYLLFDSNGNIIEQRNSETDTLGLVRYEYDSHPNPMRGLNSYGLTNPFACPNNVVRSLDSRGQIQWDRKFTYNDAGWPVTCNEGNGIEYQYHYRDN